MSDFNLSSKIRVEWEDHGFIPTKDIKNFIQLWIGSLIPDDKPIDCINKFVAVSIVMLIVAMEY